MRNQRPSKHGIAPRIESLESRQVMSADPLTGLLGGAIEHHAIDEAPLGPAIEHHSTPLLEHHDSLPPLDQHVEQPDFSLDLERQLSFVEQLREIEQTLVQAHNQTGWNTVQTNYGFNGSGQTVAIIDSGIAYDHFALGGGLGAGYRVVGGWDFTENDADPYDDGPSGSHGTHVSGIVGNSSSTHQGVASGVDLVGLRVFNDAGDGYFSWVESALQWVHTNRNNFANPITTVNLSLGVSTWNDSTIPQWANLEEEFAQLEADGIFIAVSAGNSYTSYNSPGLSYPAASPYVVPVMSTDDSGLLSYYSQRHSSAIAVPGRSIVSTVPDYTGDGNGTTDDFGSKSGTSMAAPYMAGASVLIRQAMEFAGQTNITQDMIYNTVQSTSDTFYDSATNANYQRLNLWAAIDSVMPDDDFGSTLGTAYSLGTLGDGSTASLNGHIAAVGDGDYFSFTADMNGSVTFTASNLTHDLTSAWTVYDAGGVAIATSSSNAFEFEVTANSNYTVAYASGNGLGYYSLDVSAEASFNFTEWGSVGFTQYNNIVAQGDQWYHVAASQNGFLTAQAAYQQAGGNISLELYNSNFQLVASHTGANGASRVDTLTTSGTQFYLRVLGTNSDVDFQLTNRVSASGSTITVAGTTGDDTFAMTAGSTHLVVFNGVTYNLNGTTYSTIVFQGGGGNDAATLTGTSGSDTATITRTTATLAGSGYTAQVSATKSITIHGGGGAGYDQATLNDSAGDDTFTASPLTATLAAVNGSYTNQVSGFERINAHATAGGTNDRAYLNDSAGDDRFHARPEYGLLHGANNEFYNYASGFDKVFAVATTGYDLSYQYDSAGNDRFYGRPTYSLMHGENMEFYNHASGFDRVYAYGNAGGSGDVAYMYDSAGNDRFTAHPTTALLHDVNYTYYTSVTNFEQVYAYATAGGTDDRVYLYDSAGNDRFHARPNYGLMHGENNEYYNYASGFDQVYAYSTAGGDDIAYQYDSAGNDQFYGRHNYTLMRGANNEYYNYAEGFKTAFAYANQGGSSDVAYLYDSVNADHFIGRADYSVLRGLNYEFYNYASGFDQVYAYATGGGAADRAYLYDSIGNDRFHGRPGYGLLHGENNEFYNSANGFTEVYAYGTAGGSDIAYQYGSAGDDRFYGRPDYALMRSAGAGYYNHATGFERVYADASQGGYDLAYLYDSAANDLFYARPTYSILQSANNSFYNRAASFDRVYAYAIAGGANDLAYFYDSAGNDVFDARAGQSILRGSNYEHYNYATGFDRYYGEASNGGNDTALFTKAVNGDSFTGSGNTADMAWAAALTSLTNFDNVEIHAEVGNSPSSVTAAVDYNFAQYGTWS
jgi:subtilisin family serine protease